ncbi:MAG: hypothetical protein R3E35_09230 [Rhodocyclaceae bacterium]
MGEWAFYLVLAMLVITLWKRFPYKTCAAALPCRKRPDTPPYMQYVAPTDYWTQPVGILIALLGAGGTYVSAMLVGRIGKARRAKVSVTAIEQPAPDVLSVSCQLDNKWRGHRPGQFAFITFDEKEGAIPSRSPVRISNWSVSFQIKALGDYTRTPGQATGGRSCRQGWMGLMVASTGGHGRIRAPNKSDCRRYWRCLSSMAGFIAADSEQGFLRISTTAPVIEPTIPLSPAGATRAARSASVCNIQRRPTGETMSATR